MRPSRARAAALLLVVVALARAAAAQTPAAPVLLTDVSVQRQDDTVTVDVKTSGAPKYTSEFMDGPFRLALDFEDTAYRWKVAPVAVGADPVREIRGSQYRRGIARLVIELTRKAPYTLEPHAAGLRVVFGAPKATAPPAAIAPPKPAAAPRASAPTPAFRLQGIILLDERSVAYVADTATNKVTGYRVGDKLGDGVVEAIEERHVVLRTPHGTTEMRLEDPRPGSRQRP